MNKKLLIIPALVLALGVAGLSTQASADSIIPSTTLNAGISVGGWQGHGDVNPGGPMMHRMSGVFGTVTAVSGDTITVQSKSWQKPASGSTMPTATTVTYTVDATNATVTKADAASSISAIAVGDTIMVQGTVSGTSVTATKINDGIKMPMRQPENKGEAIPAGNGQPIIGGTVTAVSGDTVTITNKGNVSYTIDVTNATVTKNGTTSTAANIAVGDNVLAQGTINGTSVTAVSLTDSAKATAGGSTTAHLGFFGAIGAFFSKLF